MEHKKQKRYLREEAIFKAAAGEKIETTVDSPLWLLVPGYHKPEEIDIDIENNRRVNGN